MADDEFRGGVARAIQVITAWLESDTPTSTSMFANEQLRAVVNEGPQAQKELVIGLMTTAATLVDDLSVATNRDYRDLLQVLPAALFAQVSATLVAHGSA